MPAIARSTIVRGPAQALFKTIAYQAAGAINIAATVETFDVPVGGSVQDKRMADQVSRITLQPSGKVEGLSDLFAVLSLPLGSMLFGATDYPLVVTNAARAITFPSAGITRPPQIRASNVATLFGDMELTAIGTDDTAFGTAGSRMTDTTGGAPSGVASADIKTAPWTIGGANLGSDIETEGGVVIDCVPAWEPIRTDSNGVINFALTGLEFRATFAPVIAVADFLDALNIHFTRGASLNSVGQDLVLTNGYITVTLSAAAILDPQLALAANINPVRQVVAVATRTSSASALGSVVIPSA